MSENYHETGQLAIACEAEADRLYQVARLHLEGRELEVCREVIAELRMFSTKISTLTCMLNRKSA